MFFAIVVVLVLLLLWFACTGVEQFDYRWPETIDSPFADDPVLLRVLYKRNGNIYETIVMKNGQVLYKIQNGNMRRILMELKTDSGKFFAASRIVNFPFKKVYTCSDNPSNYILKFQGQTIPVGCGTGELYNDIASLSIN